MKDCSYLVSIECFTYNQSSYITDAMNGFVMQQTNFPFVALIVDDASVDGEQEVIHSYVNEHFDHSLESCFKEWETEDAFWSIAQHSDNKNCHFLTVFLKQNLYRNPDKKAEVIKDWCNHKYIAFCEGDDYWTDPLKLQKQVDILETDDTLMAVVTNSKVVDKYGSVLKQKWENVVPNNVEGRYELRSFFKNQHRYPTATVCYRRTHIEEVDRMMKRMANPYFGDWSLWIILHIFGDFYYLDQVTSAYRINPTSVTHTNDRIGRSKENWKINDALLDILPVEYDDIRKSLDNDNKAWMWIDLGFAYKHEHKYLRMLWCFFVAFIRNPRELINDINNRVKTKQTDNNDHSNRI